MTVAADQRCCSQIQVVAEVVAEVIAEVAAEVAAEVVAEVAAEVAAKVVAVVVKVGPVVVKADLGGGLTEVVVGVVEQLVVSVQLGVSKVVAEGGSGSEVDIWPNLSCLSP